jgi:hypothetical protein
MCDRTFRLHSNSPVLGSPVLGNLNDPDPNRLMLNGVSRNGLMLNGVSPSGDLNRLPLIRRMGGRILDV